MFFEFVPNPEFDFLTSFAKKFNLPVEGDRLMIPPVMGKGSIRRITLAPGLKLIVHRYTLQQDFILTRIGNDAPNNLVSVIFHSNETAASLTTGEKGRSAFPQQRLCYPDSIHRSQLTDTIPGKYGDLFFSSGNHERQSKKRCLALKNPNSVVSTILNADPGFLFYESMSAEVHKIVKQVTDAREDNALNNLYYRIKVQELALPRV